MAKTHISSSGEIRKVVEAAIKTGDWALVHGGKNNHLKHKSGRSISFTRGVTCPRAHKNIARDIKHIEAGMPNISMSKNITQTIVLNRKLQHAVA